MHILIVLLFGTPSGDGSSRSSVGQRAMGAMQVSLRQWLGRRDAGVVSAASMVPGQPSSSAEPLATPKIQVPSLVDHAAFVSSTAAPAISPQEPVASTSSPAEDVLKNAATTTIPEANERTNEPVHEPAPEPTEQPIREAVHEAAKLTIKPALLAPQTRSIDQPIAPSPQVELLTTTRPGTFVVATPALPKLDEAPVVQAPLAPPNLEKLAETKPEQARVNQAKVDQTMTPVSKVPLPPLKTRSRESLSALPQVHPHASATADQDTVQAPAMPLQLTRSVTPAPNVVLPKLAPSTATTSAPALPNMVETPAPKIERAALPVAPELKVRDIPVQSVQPVAQPALQSLVPPLPSIETVAKPASMPEPVAHEVPVLAASPAAITAPLTPAVTPAVAETPASTPLTPASSNASTATPATPVAQVPASSGTSDRAVSSTSSITTTAAGNTGLDQNSRNASDRAGAANGKPNDGAPLDMEALRKQARDVGRALDRESAMNNGNDNARNGSGSGQRGLFQLQAPPDFEEHKSALAKAMEKAVKPDCREAYRGMGLAAAVPLAASGLRNGGCNW